MDEIVAIVDHRRGHRRSWEYKLCWRIDGEDEHYLPEKPVQTDAPEILKEYKKRTF